MILGIINSIFAILGIIGFYTDITILVYIGAVLNFIENIRGYFTGELKTLTFLFFSMLIGWACTGNFLGICVGICYESAIFFVLSLPLYITFLISIFKYKK